MNMYFNLFCCEIKHPQKHAQDGSSKIYHKGKHSGQETEPVRTWKPPSNEPLLFPKGNHQPDCYRSTHPETLRFRFTFLKCYLN